MRRMTRPREGHTTLSSLVGTAGVVVLLAGTVLFAFPSAASASFPGKNGSVAFAGCDDTSICSGTATTAQIWVLGSPKNPITTRGSNSEPAWSNGTRQIAFASNRTGSWHLYTMNADGTGQKQRTFKGTDNEYPAWSPSNKKIAFMSNRAGGNQIWILTLSGGVRRLTFKGHNFDPDWSPKGDEVLFTSDRTGHNEIFEMNPTTGKQLRQVTFTGTNSAASWSPDGTQIVFESSRDGGGTLWTLKVSGGPAEEIVFGDFEYGPALQPAWSPDGKQVVFSAHGPNQVGNGELWSVTLAYDPGLYDDWGCCDSAVAKILATSWQNLKQ